MRLVFSAPRMTPNRILPDLQCSLVCDGVRQESNGNLLLLGVLSQVLSPQFPITAAQLFLVNRWTAGKGTFTQSIRILSTDSSTVLTKAEAKFQLNDPVFSATTVVALQNITFKEPGPYWVEVLVDDVMKLRYAVPVFMVQQDKPGAKTGEAPVEG
jgi:hypothetical protein